MITFSIGNFSLGKKYFPLTVVIAATVILSSPENAFADWGYDDNTHEPPAQETRGNTNSSQDQGQEVEPPQLVAPKALRIQPPAQKPTTSKPITKPKAAAPQAKSGSALPSTKSAVSQGDIKLAVAQWLDLYSLVADRELTEEEESTLTNYLNDLLAKGKTANKPNMFGILQFWPQVKSAMAESAVQKDNYRALFHSLLRLDLSGKQLLKVKPSLGDANDAEAGAGKMVITKAKPVEEMGIAEQGDEAISCLLGPQRIAKQGSPPLTEDAINAYADMACFLYEQKNPGKTVDANDNRTLFAEAISYKYGEAPTAADRAAMASFDLTWSIFKIEWESADVAGRRELLQHLGKKKNGTGSSIAQDPVLNCVLINGPWKSLVAG